MTAETSPVPPSVGRGLPVLSELSPVSRIALGATLFMSVLGIALDFGLHVDKNVVFVVSAVAILGLAWVVGLSTERLGIADRPSGRRHPQRDVRQHRRADHRLLRPAGRPDRGREGVADGLDHRQPAARPRREHPRRRAPPRDRRRSALASRRRTHRSSCSRSSVCSCRPSSRSRRAIPSRGR